MNPGENPVNNNTVPLAVLEVGKVVSVQVVGGFWTGERRRRKDQEGDGSNPLMRWYPKSDSPYCTG